MTDILELNGVAIEGIAASLPESFIDNDERIAKATGIVKRRVANDESSAIDFCIKAAEKIISDCAIKLEEFGAVINVSFTQRERMPCGACKAQAALNLPTSVISFDVMQACAGYGYGLYLAGLLALQTGKKVLLLDGDRQSEFLDATDPATSPLLGDGGTATIVAPCKDASPWRFAFFSDGSKGDVLKLEKSSTIKMDGFGVFRFVASDVATMIKEFMAKVELADDFLFAPHQANVYIVRQLAKACGISEDKLLISADKFGNLASASVPATIAANAQMFSQGKTLLIAGFGGGLSASFAQVNIPIGCRVISVK